MAEVDGVMHERITDWKAYVRGPLTQRALLDSNNRYEALEDIAGYVEKQDRAWRSAPEGTTTHRFDDGSGRDVVEVADRGSDGGVAELTGDDRDVDALGAELSGVCVT